MGKIAEFLACHYQIKELWDEENLSRDDKTNFVSEWEHGVQESKSNPDPQSDSEDVALLRRDAQYHLSADRMDSRLAGDLSSGLCSVLLTGCY